MKLYFLKNSVPSFLIALLLAPSAFIFFVPKAKAAVNCTGILLGKLTLGLFGSGVNRVLSVPTSNVVLEKDTNITAGNSTGLLINECIIKPLVRAMVRSALREITRSTVAWINSGFQGSPGFITNPEGFLREVGDQAAGQVIESIAPQLCGPFSLQLRLSLGLHYSYSSFDRIGCRLSDVQKNIYNSFIGGNFNGDGNGWRNWLAVTQNPANNPYGAYIESKGLINQRITRKVNAKLEELSWGKGFLSYRDCLDYDDKIGPDGEVIDGPCKKYGPIKTPGTVIEGQLEKTLGTELDHIGLAQDIDDILGGFIGQMVKQVFSASGLYGSSQPSRDYGGSSFLEAYTREALAESAGTGSTGLSIGETLPTGIPSNICATFNRSETYSVVNGSVAITKITNGQAETKEARKTDGSLWSVRDLSDVDAYCVRAPIVAIAERAIGELPVPTQNILDQNQAPIKQNLSYGQPASQSSDQFGAVTANKAVDGIQTNDNYIMPAITGLEENPWWQVTLDKDSFIDSVKIYKASDYAGALGTFSVIVYDSKQKVIWTSPSIETSSQTPIPLLVPVGKVGRVVRIQRFDGVHYLQLAEVEVVGYEGATTAPTGGVSSGALAPFSLNINPEESSTHTVLKGATFTTSFAVIPNGAKEGLSAKVTLERKNYGSNYSPIAFGILFGEFKVKVTDVTANNKVVAEPDLIALSAGETTGDIFRNLSVTRDQRFSLTQTMRTQYYTPVDSQGIYRLVTEFRDGAGNFWKQTTHFQVVSSLGGRGF